MCLVFADPSEKKLFVQPKGQTKKNKAEVVVIRWLAKLAKTKTAQTSQYLTFCPVVLCLKDIP